MAQLAAAGRSSSEIAGQLLLSARTIETHLGRICSKLGINSQRQLMAMRGDVAMAHGEGTPPTR